MADGDRVSRSGKCIRYAELGITDTLTRHAAEEAEAAGPAVQIIDVSEHQPRRIPSSKWRELIKKVWKADPLLCPQAACRFVFDASRPVG